MTQIKEKIINELKKQTFPDLELLFSEEALNHAPEILEELLQQDKAEFEELLQTPKEDITFDSFEDEGVSDYYWSLLNHYQNVNNVDKMRKIIDDFRPKLQDFGNYVAYNKNYFDMLVCCDEQSKLDTDQKRAMYLRIKSFKDRGIDLPKQKQERLKELNKILSELSNNFSNNIVDDEAQFEYIIEDLEVIKNLPQDVLDIAKSQAEDKQKQGYLFTADPTGYVAIMKYCDDATMRSDFEKSRNSFASSGKYDNRENILNILKFKKEKAQLLGYNNFAELSLHNKMADSPKQVIELIEGISQKAKKKSHQELELLKKEYNLESLETYDIGFYSRKLKEEKYQLDEKEIKQYFEYNSVLDYLHDFVNSFFGIELKEIQVHGYDKEIKVYEVYKQGELISYYLLDAFYRKEKRGGAWADNLREKNIKFKKIPLVVNVCNFQKADTTLLLMRDVETLFHEFGHALHEMLSQSDLSELSGFGVEWDFVELPSQLLENWVSDSQSLKKLAKHYKTGEYISDELINKLENLQTFMSGGFVARQNEFALLDLNLYAQEVPNSIEMLDEKVLDLVNKYGIFPRGEEYKMYCSFGHIFGGGYAAGYYSYMWAEILEADVFARIKELGMFEKSTGEKYLNTILGQGTRKPASELFFDFMGREVSNEAFMKRKGL